MLTVGIAKRMNVNGIKLTDYVLPSFFLIDVIQTSSAGIVTAEIQLPQDSLLFKYDNTIPQ